MKVAVAQARSFVGWLILIGSLLVWTASPSRAQGGGELDPSCPENLPREALVEWVETGQEEAIPHAEQLAERFPAAALPPLLRGLEISESHMFKYTAVNLIGDLPGEASLEALLELVDVGFGHREFFTALPDLRVAVAQGLRRRGRPEGTAAVAALWEQLVTNARERPQSAAGTAWMVFGTDLVEFLCVNEEGVRILSRGITEMPSGVRSMLVQSFSFGLFSARWTTGEDTLDHPEDTSRLSAAHARSIEELLISALKAADDDLSALTISQLWPSRYHFREQGTRSQRAADRARILNVAREAAGEAALPIPAEPIVPSLERNVIRVLRRELRRSRKGEDHEQVLRKIEGLGLRGLQVLLPTEDPGELGLATRLGAIINKVSLRSSPQISIDEEVVEVITGARQTVLTADSAGKLARFLRARLPDPEGRFMWTFWIERGNQGLGVELSVLPAVLPEQKGQISQSPRVVRLAGEQISGIGLPSDCFGPPGSLPDNWPSNIVNLGLEEALTRLFQAPPDQAFSVYLSWTSR